MYTRKDDDWADEVRLRVAGAPSDLHDLDAKYHRGSYCRFFSNGTVGGNYESHSKDRSQHPALAKLLKMMRSDKNKNPSLLREQYI